MKITGTNDTKLDKQLEEIHLLMKEICKDIEEDRHPPRTALQDLEFQLFAYDLDARKAVGNLTEEERESLIIEGKSEVVH